MAGMSVSTGLISGIDYDTMISQLMQVEANPQTLLKNKLTATQADATAYRAVNTKFDALRSAAEALTKATTWAAAKATSTSTAITATAGPSAATGALTFTVTSLAASHSVLSAASWATSTTTFGQASPLVLVEDGKTTEIALTSGATLADAVAAINGANAGVTAAAVKTDTGYRLQVASASTGEGSRFSLTPTGGTGTAFPTLTAGADAKLTVGDPAANGFTAVSSTNTFTELMPGTTLTVGATGGPVTISVVSDPAAVATAVQAMVTAANAVLASITGYTDSTNSNAVLKGDSTLRSLTSQVLDTISTAIGGNESAATAGLKLTRDGQLAFDSAVFTAKLASDPAVAQRLVNGQAASAGPNLVSGDADDKVAVQGVAQRLLALATKATDTTTGILLLKAKSEDDEAADLQDQIEGWDRRLELRKASLTAQFTAMETMLGTLQNQGSWLSSQISSLPRWSSSDS